MECCRGEVIESEICVIIIIIFPWQLQQVTACTLWGELWCGRGETESTNRGKYPISAVTHLRGQTRK